MPRTFSKEVDSAITLAADRYDLDPEWLRAIARVESGGNPKAQTGSYSGLFQLSPQEAERVGLSGDLFDPQKNATAAASLLRSHADAFQKDFGRAASLPELYLAHQQGYGGLKAHMQNPDKPAWESMASTKEGRARGEAWAKKAISGNLTPDAKKQYGEEITSGDFLKVWGERLGAPSEPEATVRSPAPPGAELRSAQPTVGDYIADVIQEKTGLSRDWSRRAAAPLGAVGEALKEPGRALGRAYEDPSRGNLAMAGAELAMAAPPGRLGRSAGKMIKEVYGRPTPGGPTLRYPEYPLVDPYEGFRSPRPIIGYHGGHEFEPELEFPLGRFRSEKIGTGEGTQIEGYGHYLSGHEDPMTKFYRKQAVERARGKSFSTAEHVAADMLKSKRADAIKELEDLASSGYGSKMYKEALEMLKGGWKFPGASYEVAVHADPKKFLDLDEPLFAQSEHVIKALEKTFHDIPAVLGKTELSSEDTGTVLLQTLERKIGGPKVAQVLEEAGISGTKYLDQDIPSPETPNFVVFNPQVMEILRRYGLLPPVLAGLLASGEGEGRAREM